MCNSLVSKRTCSTLRHDAVTTNTERMDYTYIFVCLRRPTWSITEHGSVRFQLFLALAPPRPHYADLPGFQHETIATSDAEEQRSDDHGNPFRFDARQAGSQAEAKKIELVRTFDSARNVVWIVES